MNLDRPNGLLALNVVADSQSFTAAARVFSVIGYQHRQGETDGERRTLSSVKVATLSATARCVRKASISGAPIVCGCRLP